MELPKVVPDGDSMRDRIIRAAYVCFGRFSIAKTTIEDIASEANVSRPTIYKHFENKTDIFDEICILESRALNTALRAKIDRSKAFSEVLSDSIVVIVRLAMENVYLRRSVEFATASSHAFVPGGRLHSEYQMLWGNFLKRAQERGDLAADLSIDEVISWIGATEGMLMRQLDVADLSDESLHRIVSRMIVAPLLANPFADGNRSALRRSSSRQTAATTVRKAPKP